MALNKSQLVPKLVGCIPYACHIFDKSNLQIREFKILIYCWHMIAALKKTNKSNSKKRVEGRKAVSSREYDSLHFYDHTSTCIPFVNFVFYSCLKIWGGCSFNKTTYVQTQSKDFHLFSSTKLLLRYLIISTCYRLRLNLHKY